MKKTPIVATRLGLQNAPADLSGLKKKHKQVKDAIDRSVQTQLDKNEKLAGKGNVSRPTSSKGNTR